MATTVSGSLATGYRIGCADLVTTWRRMVDDTGAAIWTNAEAQEILDNHRRDVWGELLVATSIIEDNDTVWKTYASAFGDMEKTTGGTSIFRVYNSGGTAIGTANYTPGYQRGEVVFAADQAGSARYLDARTYDLNAAAVEGWKERMGLVSGYYSFSGDGQSWSRSDYFQHCKAMAEHYGASSPMTVTSFTRSDLA